VVKCTALVEWSSSGEHEQQRRRDNGSSAKGREVQEGVHARAQGDDQVRAREGQAGSRRLHAQGVEARLSHVHGA
jgi:hypothetical protein